MKKAICVLCAGAVLAVLTLAGAAIAAQFGKDEMKRMSVFVSNFTEQGLYDFDVERESDGMLWLGGPDAAPDLIRFGIRHNYINNFKTRIKKCTEKNCKHGSLTLDGKFVKESVKKYFGLDVENRSITDSEPSYHFDGKLYHFDGADGEAVYYAEVTSASRNGDEIDMSGELYNTENKKDRPATFRAVARPCKWKGKDTWSIVRLKTDFK